MNDDLNEILAGVIIYAKSCMPVIKQKDYEYMKRCAYCLEKYHTSEIDYFNNDIHSGWFCKNCIEKIINCDDNCDDYDIQELKVFKKIRGK